MKHISLFSGIGGFDLASEWMGWQNVAHCELNPFGQKILKYYWPNAISYEDITKTDFTIHKGAIDIVTGGFPCQDISTANYKSQGITGERSSLWTHFARAIYEIRPEYIVIENSSNLLRKGFEKVLFDLSEIGYNAEWECYTAEAFGLPHKRERIFIVAYPTSERQSGSRNILKNTRNHQASRDWETNRVINAIQRKTLPPLCDSNHGFSTQLALQALGNAVCPIIPFSIFKAIQEYEKLNHENNN